MVHNYKVVLNAIV